MLYPSARRVGTTIVSLIAGAIIGSADARAQQQSFTEPPESSAIPAQVAPTGITSTAYWALRIASWNVLNLSNRKVGLPPDGPLRNALVERYARIISQYDIVILQEVLDGGEAVTNAIANRPELANHNCTWVSQPSGRQGRQERYGVCYVRSTSLSLDSFYDAMGQPVVALDGGNQTAQNVWMRPPIRAQFTYVLPDNNRFLFNVYTIHTKPAYGAGARPPGTPANAPNNGSVRNELTSLEVNIANTFPGNNRVVIGDLNADCASYPSRDRGTNFPAGWTWFIDYGEKTNTAPNSSCAYDRIILDDGILPNYLAHGIYTPGINERVQGERVSDHYLVWVLIGGTVKKPQLVVGSKVGTSLRLKRSFASGPLPDLKRPRINSTGLRPKALGSAIYIVNYDQERSYFGAQTYDLIDVRGTPTPVVIQKDGTLLTDVVWLKPVKGQYNVVLDWNGDGKYNRLEGDVVNNDNEIDFIVVDSTQGFNDVVTLGDNAQVREVFNENRARNIYGLAKNLPTTATVDLYVVSAALLPANFNWDDALKRGDLNLSSVSAPVRKRAGSIMVPNLTASDKVLSVETADDGTIFTSIWPQPYVVFNMRALTRPLQPPVYVDGYATDDDGVDPCADVWEKGDQNLLKVCNVGHQFTDHYGNSFNLVIDVNRNGFFDNGDKVDVTNIADMRTFFKTHEVLDSKANGDPAVGEYKEFLNDKLSPKEPLTENNIYDDATEALSSQYMCTETVPRLRFHLVEEGAAIGFRILDQIKYIQARQMTSGLYHFAEAEFEYFGVANDSDVCIHASHSLELGEVTADKNASTAIHSESIILKGNITAAEDSGICIAATQTLIMAPAVGYLTLINPPIGAGALIAIVGVAIVESAACRLGY